MALASRRSPPPRSGEPRWSVCGRKLRARLPDSHAFGADPAGSGLQVSGAAPLPQIGRSEPRAIKRRPEPHHLLTTWDMGTFSWVWDRGTFCFYNSTGSSPWDASAGSAHRETIFTSPEGTPQRGACRTRAVCCPRLPNRARTYRKSAILPRAARALLGPQTGKSIACGQLRCGHPSWARGQATR
jgi:hypothetical protein